MNPYIERNSRTIIFIGEYVELFMYNCLMIHGLYLTLLLYSGTDVLELQDYVRWFGESQTVLPQHT